MLLEDFWGVVGFLLEIYNLFTDFWRIMKVNKQKAVMRWDLTGTIKTEVCGGVWLLGLRDFFARGA